MPGAEIRTLVGMRTLVLWDVDYTLLDCDGLGREAHEAAFTRVTGLPPNGFPFLGGRTDLGVITTVLRANGVEPTPDVLAEACAALAAEFADRAALLPGRGRALDGAAAALSHLSGDPRLVQSVLTGNLRPIAAYKLAAFGLDAHLDLTIGAYGDDHADRAELVGLARRRAAERHGEPCAAIVVIGDTVNDVAAGRTGGAYTIAVATGKAPAADLRAAGPDALLDDLTDLPALAAAIDAARPGEPRPV